MRLYLQLVSFSGTLRTYLYMGFKLSMIVFKVHRLKALITSGFCSRLHCNATLYVIWLHKIFCSYCKFVRILSLVVVVQLYIAIIPFR